MDVVIEPLIVPATLDGPDAEGFLAMVEIGNDCWARWSGTDLHEDDPVEFRARAQETPYRVMRGAIARVGGQIVGAVRVDIDKSMHESVELDVMMTEEHENGGPVVDALQAEGERIAREHGRTVLQSWTIHRADPVENRLVPPTGAGWIPADDANTKRMLAAGYRLGQVERNSRFDLQGDFEPVERLLAEAVATAGPDYRAVWWAGPTPPEYADGYAKAIGRMHSDVPSGDLVMEESKWDAERVFERDVRFAQAGSTFGVTLVIHEPTGEVAAFNEMTIGPDRTKPTSQWGTLVMPEHRGHRLGSIVKCVGLSKWHEAMPDSPCVSTFNAEENRYMLDVNEKVGFVPASYAGAWEKKLA